MKPESKLKIALVIAFLLGCFVIFFMQDFIAIDECLDSGGRWNYQTKICEK